MAKGIAGEKEMNSVIIHFQDEDFRLSIEHLQSQRVSTAFDKGWRSPTLQFQSFRDGRVTLLNTCKDRSFELVLQVKESQLLVGCSCGSDQPSICEHAYSALSVIIWHLGERYFEKLRPRGLMEMAFAHKSYFDRKESIAGLDVICRPEHQAIFRLARKGGITDVRAIMEIPAAESAPHTELPIEGLSYIMVIAYRNKHLPAVLPCMGLLNKERNAIKSFRPFLTGIQKEYNHLLSNVQQSLNAACYQLWKLVEKLPGLISQQITESGLEALQAVFDGWRQMLPALKQQPFLYCYLLYGVKELRLSPNRRRLIKISLSTQVPVLKFVLTDKGAVYRLEMQVWINNKLLKEYDAGTTLFISHQQTLFMLSPLRDAAIAEWIHRSGGWLTIFKEHFAEFEQEVLLPLEQSYPVARPGGRRAN